MKNCAPVASAHESGPDRSRIGYRFDWFC